MARAPDPRVEQTRVVYLKGIKSIEIANQLNLPEGTVRHWRYTHKQDSERSDRKSKCPHKKGSPKGSKNTFGNKGGAAPEQNKSAEEYDFFPKYLPGETVPTIQEMPTDPLDILWDQVQIAYAAIIRTQSIMYVKDRDDVTTTRIGHKDGDTVTEERQEVQQAWDKQGNSLQAQARAQKTLEGLIKQYDELLHKRWDLVSKEQEARIAQLRAQTDKLIRNNQELEDMDGIEGGIYGGSK